MNPQAQKEKKHAAMTSVVAAVGLTGFKIVVGLLTGSLGILAEAVHSALDLVAAIVTYFAVYYAAKPADRTHLYGHGKVENLSALFETLLLLVTCVWIIYEAVQRLFFKSVHVDPSIWAFIVMVTSMGIDYSRSRILYRAARKHNSQALEADALHFSTDIWSSAVVILGLAGLLIAENYPALKFLAAADSVAAFIVALIVIYVSIRLGVKSTGILLDAAPAGLYEKIKKTVECLPGITNCHNIRMRYLGPTLFIDIHILTDGKQSLEKAHSLTEAIEREIQKEHADVDVTVHPEPDYRGKPKKKQKKKMFRKKEKMKK